MTGNVSRETQERLLLLEHLVRKWNPVINLVSKGTLDQIAERHIRDSMQIYDVAPVQADLWCDFGSGGGFPGLIVAVLSEDRGRNLTVQLIESDGRKATFLREAARQLKLNTIIIHDRIEALKPLSADVVSARALAPLETLCGYASMHLRKDGAAIFPKGSTHVAEVERARKTWNFELQVEKSLTEPSAAILVLRNIRHVQDRH